MKGALTTQLRKSVWGLSAAYVVNDALWRLKLRAGLFDTLGGTTHSALEPSQSVAYIRDVFEDYKRYGEVTEFHGRAAELGPGDNAGVALMLRAHGCASVDLVDRYHSRRDAKHQQRIYDELARQYAATRVWPEGQLDEQSIPGIRWRIGQAAEDFFASAVRERSEYDFIVSRSVLEHLYDPLGCLSSMVSVLSQSGKLIHKVDLRDHGMFAPTGNPLKFLEVPSVVYRHMTRYSGRPNRILFHQYRDTLKALEQAGRVRYKLLVTRLAGAGDVLPHVPLEDVDEKMKAEAVRFVENQRRRFAREFAQVASLDLAIQGMFIVAQRADGVV